MNEREFADMIHRNILESLKHSAPFTDSIEVMARKAAQGVLSLLAIVEIEECCPLCGKEIGPSIAKRHVLTLPAPKKPSTPIATVLGHTISTSEETLAECSCGVKMSSSQDVAKHLKEIDSQ